jgi:hypothetical protein
MIAACKIRRSGFSVRCGGVYIWFKIAKLSRPCRACSLSPEPIHQPEAAIMPLPLISVCARPPAESEEPTHVPWPVGMSSKISAKLTDYCSSRCSHHPPISVKRRPSLSSRGPALLEQQQPSRWPATALTGARKQVCEAPRWNRAWADQDFLERLHCERAGRAPCRGEGRSRDCHPLFVRAACTPAGRQAARTASANARGSSRAAQWCAACRRVLGAPST